MSETLFFHVDLDAFFASVEILDHPEYKNKPLIIGHVGPRSVVSTCSYEARKYGVSSAMPISTALKLCPRAICVPPNYKRYVEKSREVMSILKEYAPSFLQASIDEAYLDMSGTEKIYGDSYESATYLKNKVFAETQLTISIGVGPSRFIAKLASDYRKPNGLTVVSSSQVINFIDAVGLKKLFGLGKATYQRLLNLNISTTQELREKDVEYLKRHLGDHTGEYLYKISRGIDPGIYNTKIKSHSISAERTFFPDLFDKEIIETLLLHLAEEVFFRSLDEGYIAKSVSLKLRYGDFTTYTIQETPDSAIYSSKDLFNIAKKLLYKKYNNNGIRLLGITLQSLYKANEVEQLELFNSKRERERALEKAILMLNKSGNKIQRATHLIKSKDNDNS